jgi:translation initiation factor 1A
MMLPVLGGAKKKPKGTRNAGANMEKRELVFREDGQEYARCPALLGNRRCSVECMDGTTRLGTIRGSMKRGAINRVRAGDFVLVGLRDYQDEKCDIVHKYDMEEVRRLQGYGEIDASVKIGESETNPAGDGIDLDGDIEFTFSDGDIDEI